MMVYYYLYLPDFEFWGGAKVNASKLSHGELLLIQEHLKEITFDERWSETMVNDFIWFDEEIWLEWLGITEEEWEERFA